MILDLSPIKERLSRATKGWPWNVRPEDGEVKFSRLIGANITADGESKGGPSLNGGIWVAETKGPGAVDNAAFIASAPTDIAALVEEVEKQRREIGALRILMEFYAHAWTESPAASRGIAPTKELLDDKGSRARSALGIAA